MIGWPADNIFPEGHQFAREVAQELGTLSYVNLDDSAAHGNFEIALQLAKERNKPILAHFAEWPGWSGCKSAGLIFSDVAVNQIVHDYFVPAAFNTWDRSKSKYNKAHKAWGNGLESSWWGYLRVISVDGRTILSSTNQITGFHHLEDVKQAIRIALIKLGIDIPDYFIAS